MGITLILAQDIYGNVWLNLLTRWCKLKPDWEFYHVGWQSQDRPHKRLEGFTMLPMKKAEYGFDTVIENLLRYQPDILLTLADVGWQSGFIPGIQEARKQGWKGKWIMYTPVDTEGWAYTWDGIFDKPDLNIAMAKFGKDQMILNKVPNVIEVKHGVDLNTFKPINRDPIREKAKLQDKFVVGFVGRNQRRKMLDRLIQTFSNFAKGKEDVVILLHTDSEPPKEGWSLPYLFYLYRDTVPMERVVMTKSNLDIQARQTIQPESMNEIYNLMDVFLYTTGGEGFGLPGIECQASGTPLIMTEYTTGNELARPEWQIPVLKDSYGRKCIDRGTNGVYFAYPDDVEGAKLLEKMYNLWKNDREAYNKLRQEARSFAEKYNWDEIAQQWITLFEKEA